MNKSLIALAVAGALAASAAANAETTLYGSARLSVNATSVDHDILGVKPVNDGTFWDVRNEASRLGVKGSEDLGGGLSAIYQYEFGVRADGSASGNPFSQRLSWVGVKGGFGSVTIGRQWSPYYNAIALDDVFNSDDTATSYYWLGTANGSGRLSNSLVYTTPNFSGFTGAAAIVMDGSGTPNNTPSDLQAKNSIDLWDVAVSYNNGPLVLGAAYRSFESAGYSSNGDGGWYTPTGAIVPAGSSLWGVAASYKFAGVFNLIANYQEASYVDSAISGGRLTDWNPKTYGLTGEYTFGNEVLRAGWGYLDTDQRNFGSNLDDNSFNQWKLGWQHNLSKRTRLWLEYTNSDFKTQGSAVPSADAPLGSKYDNFSIGMRHDF